MTLDMYKGKIVVKAPDATVATEEQELSDLCDRIEDAVNDAVEDVKNTLAADIAKYNLTVDLDEE